MWQPANGNKTHELSQKNMAIEKLNLEWQNKGESGYENSKMNKEKMEAVTDKIDEIIDAFACDLNSSSGYQKFPSGLVMQWGTTSVTLDSTEVAWTITFPIAFENGVLNAQVGLVDVGPGRVYLTSGIAVSGTSKTNLTLLVKSTTDFVSGRTVSARWFALGY